MTVDEVRSKYLAFFKARGHAIIPSAPIVPENDPTTLFTSSGMQPLVPYLLGTSHPEGARLVNSQLSFRAGDIEEVGDNRHTTFFEMLGNWSLGDYFKREQLSWVYEFLTEELKLPKERLWVTCFEGDDKLGLPKDTESAEIWKKIGMPDDHILFYDAKKNWWSRSGTPDKMPTGEPGGPDSEIFYEFTSVEHNPSFGETCHPNCDCGRFMEIGNSVFMEYLKQADGSFGKLPKQNVDFGGGLERFTAATNDNPDIFQIDAFDWTRTNLERITGKKYGEDEITTRIFRVILDHVRAALFIMASGVRPSNSEQGYILRRLLRRSMLRINTLKREVSDGSFLSLGWIIESFVKVYGEQYPRLKDVEKDIQNSVIEEENKFYLTIGHGTRELERELEKFVPRVREITPNKPIEVLQPLTGEVLFRLYSTFGFPAELILEEFERVRSKYGLVSLSSDRKERILQEFSVLMKKHKEQSSIGAAQKFAGGLADQSEQTVKYHTAHHLLLKALQMVLGPDVHQRGSNITSERLRIDFSYGTKMTDEQKADVEKIVNEKIAERLPVIRTDMKKEEAEKLGAEHEFGATYPDIVSVYSVGPLDNAFSIEFCGGPHVANTSELVGTFKILKEEASSAGVRRIKAVLQ